jgi:Zn-dependent peptidase ImmA (M78 family)
MPRREQVPITRSVITWARDRAGFSLAEATQFFPDIADWEHGNTFPTYAQLEALSEKFKLPIAVFFFPEPPDLPPINQSFRTLPESQFAAIPRRVRFLVRKASALQINLSELCQGHNPARRLITRDLMVSQEIAVDALANVVRNYIGVSLDEQFSWRRADDAFKHWRQAFAEVGIFVFKDAFRVADYSGFCMYDDEFPIIYVNNTTSETRQIFTLFHELAHLLFHTSGIDTITDEYIPALPLPAQRIEVLCNRFAAQFLVPEPAFNEAFVGLDASERTAERLAARFHVSREVIYRKFLDRGLIDQATYTTAAVRWADQRGEEKPGGNFYWTQIAYLGRRYIELALSQYYQNRIDENQLAEYLDFKPRHVNKLEEYLGRGER